MARKALDIISGWYESSFRGSYNNTYKFALGLSLLDYIHEIKADPKEATVIAYQDLIERWARYYWDHTVVYKIQESTSPRQQPKIVSFIKDIAENHSLDGVKWSKTPKSAKNELMDRIRDNRDLLDNPVSRFQSGANKNSKGTGDPNGEGFLYAWDQKAEELRVSAEAIAVLKENHSVLKDMTLFAWVRFIEKYNSVPGLIKKISLEVPSPSLQKFRKLFEEFPDVLALNDCFYCGSGIETYDLDHMVPFSYLLTDDLFNLVSSCPSCNRSKNDRYPKPEFIERASDRNKELFSHEVLSETLAADSADEAHALLPEKVAMCKAARFKKWDGP